MLELELIEHIADVGVASRASGSFLSIISNLNVDPKQLGRYSEDMQDMDPQFVETAISRHHAAQSEVSKGGLNVETRTA